MQEDDPSIVIKAIFKDITNLEDVIQESKSIAEQLENDKLESIETFIDETRKIVTTLKNSVEKIHELFDSNFKDRVVPVKKEPTNEFGKIKLVDLSKLIDPKKSVNNFNLNDSVVTISDSEPEEHQLDKTKKGANSKSSLNNNASDHENHTSSKSILKNKANIIESVVVKRVSESPVKKVQFSDPDRSILSKLSDSNSASSSSDSGEESQVNTNKSKLKRKRKKRKISDKFSWKCCVNLTRIPADKLKEHYLQQKEKKDLKRLVNMKTLKRARNVIKDSTDSDSSEKKTTKIKHSHKKNKTAASDPKSSSQDPNDSSDSAATSDKSISKEAEAKTLVKENDDVANIQETIDENTLTAIQSDADVEKESADEENEVSKQKKQKKKSKENSLNDKAKDVNSDELTNKSDNINCVEKSSEEVNNKNSDAEGSSENDITSKKTWKHDQLLNSTLSDSDSDNIDAFQKKNDKEKQKSKIMKKKTKRVISDSDDSFKSAQSSNESDTRASSDSEAEKKEEKKTSKRSRIKRVNDSSSDDEDKSTRKQIRKVINRDSLAETTKRAEKEEAERKARIIERQKKYNDIFEADKLEKASLSKVVLDFNEETEEELLRVDKKLVKHLKPHQGKGVQFMWDASFESIERAKSTKGSGCILAHCMGLGKTLQVITLVHTLITNKEKTGVNKVLVVTPLSTVLNWVDEFRKWLPDDDEVVVMDLIQFKQNRDRMYQIMEWHKHGGVLVMGYDMFRNLCNENNKRITKKMKAECISALLNPGPDLVVCDEGHLLKNEKTSISISMNKISTLRRIVLTGTPLQNNLKEYWCMVQFVKPNLLGTYKEYLNRFVNPITNGQYTDSTQHDIQIMRKRSHVLHKLLDGIVQRRDYAVLAPFLPPKHEYVVFINLTETQINLYSHYMKEFARRSTGTKSSFLFVDFQELQRICTHPRVLLDKSIQNKIAQDKKDWENEDEESEGSIKDFIDDGSEAETTSSSSDDEKKSDTEVTKPTKSRRRTRAMAVNDGDTDVEEVVADEGPSDWWRQYTKNDELDNIVYSGKLHLLFEILHQCEHMGDKILVFSQSLYSLNIIEYFLARIDEANQNNDSSKVCGYSSSWSIGLDYFRLDGSTSCDNRALWCQQFNDPENVRARLFLISTRAGGLGINLVAANRVIIFDVSWNPSHDVQSIYRVYRFGQLKPTYIYRFVTLGTMEMKIYERQVIKQAISKRVIDEQQIDRHYNQNDLAELYKFEPKPPEPRPIPLVPKDILLGELLQNHEDLIYKYHEHQSLLENKVDEVLDEEERKAAWEEFENEKKNRQFNTGTSYSGATGISNLPMSVIQQCLANIITREHPTFTTAEINGVMPQLLQELNSQVAAGEMTMYYKIMSEVKLIQNQQQQQKLREYYEMQQHQQALRMFQKYQQQIQAGVPSADANRFMQQYQANIASNSNQNTAPARIMDPNEVVSID